jgi:uncharacterized protein YkwD
VVGLLLSVLGIAAFLLPISSDEAPQPTSAEAQRRTETAADSSPSGFGALGTAPASSPPTTASSRPGPTPAAPRSATPTASARRTATAGSSSRAAASGNTAQEDQVTVLVNRERATAGCDPVRTDERLRSAARGHSQDMATNDYFSHTAPDGDTFVDRAAAAGYPRDQAGGENIAMGYGTPADVMDGWMDSEGHRANILNCDFKAIGVGLARDSDGTPYWTQVFGRT